MANNDSNYFKEAVYPFTTEDINGYMSLFNLKGKNVLTVGSSCDQVLNAISFGAKEVTLFDINENAKRFFEIKKDIILTTPKENYYKKILSLNIHYSDDIFSENDLKSMNYYMKDNNTYYELREKLKKAKVDFLTGNLFELQDVVISKKYDLIVLSNILQYLNGTSDKSYEDKVFEIYSELKKHLNNDGVIQLLYLYGSIFPDGFAKLINHFLKNDCMMSKYTLTTSNDSIITVGKNA